MSSNPSLQSTSTFASEKRRIEGRLNRIAAGRADFWDFRENTEEIASKKLFQYPAMMVPAMQKQVIATMLHGRPDVQTIVDPFLGSGTILVLAMLNGRSFVGQDINPLSLLIAKTRAYSLNYPELAIAIDQVLAEAKRSWACTFAVRFVGQSKWFTDEASVGLSRLRKAIRKQPNQNTRRFLWVCLAETIRLNSNSRTSTFKLHVKPEDKRSATTESVLKTYETISAHNLNIVRELATTLQKAQLLDKQFNYTQSIKIAYGNSKDNLPTIDWSVDGKCDLVVTSPPYGDNRTTVPYGQAAWLPLQWIDLTDIDANIPKHCADRAYDIDNRSLGGDRSRKLFNTRMTELAEAGPITSKYIDRLGAISNEGASRFVHFAFDVKQVLERIANICKVDAKIIITLGHRNIRGTVCPLTDVCAEIFAQLKVREIVRIDRRIPSKRMPEKNSHSSTINHEYISILHKSE